MIGIMASKENQRNLDRDINTPSKRQRQASPSKSNTTKLDDLNDDVLVHIFKQMELADALNMADTSKRFKQAVERTVIRNVIKKNLHLEIDRVKSNDMRISEKHEKAYVHDLFVALKLLRHFGHLFSGLIIEYSTKVSQHVRDELSRYVSEYCSGYVDDLTLVNCRKEDMKVFGKPFSKTTLVTLSKSHLVSERAHLIKCFPKVFSLTLDDISTTHFKCIEVHFPKLNHLKLNRVQISCDSLLACLHLNPQIRQLQISFSSTRNLVQKISKYLPYLETLEIDDDLESMSNFNGDFHNSFKCLKLLNIRVGRTFNSQNLINFIAKHPTIQSLYVRTYSPAVNILTDDKAFLLSVGKCLPYLKQAQFLGFTMSVEAIHCFLSEGNVPNLKQFFCKLKDKSELNDLRSRLGDEWTIELWANSLHVKRKNISEQLEDILASVEFISNCVLNEIGGELILV